jgi:hypothetical protein
MSAIVACLFFFALLVFMATYVIPVKNGNPAEGAMNRAPT